ncbi:DUF6282 family protein [Pseudoruegeria sp. SK021]|uniref:DUF6282 family protein n=1 Tax=Pseudoruegeria sp. SK021 TaxID=1933035 RepID=UPI000A24A0ED|nr:DUF6282 family protein [Pseudoruegeria sp. SK021]OSP53995.1 hypothetical protein BV911_14785 [Pseudoruegeria sp. SK021]
MPTTLPTERNHPREVTIPGQSMLVGAVDSHVHCCPHINRRTVSLFDAVYQAAEHGLVGLGLMDVFANTSGLAALANRELGHLGVDVFGGVILEPYAGGLSERVVQTALKMGYAEGDGARFISLPCHHTAFVAKSEGRSPAYIETCLAIPETGPLPDPLPAIIDACVEADVVFNLGHLSGGEHVRVAEFAAQRGCTRMLCPAGYLDQDEAQAIAATGAKLEYSFFVFSHATDIPQTMVDRERHKFARADFGRAVSILQHIGADSFVLSSDSGALVLPPPVEAFRGFIAMFASCGVSDADLRKMTVDNPIDLFKVGLR